MAQPVGGSKAEDAKRLKDLEPRFAPNSQRITRLRPADHDARAEGWTPNHRKIQRLRREAGLQVPQRRRRKRGGTATAPPDDNRRRAQPGMGGGLPVRLHHRRGPTKIVSIIDEHTRECLGGMVERSITGEHLIAELDRRTAQRDTYPTVLRCDNGPNLACGAMADQARQLTRYWWPICGFE